MKKSSIALLLFSSIFLVACNKCSENPACKDSSDNGNQITCTAYWESWFYDKSSNSCQLEGYSACGPRGFETKEECLECKCK